MTDRTVSVPPLSAPLFLLVWLFMSATVFQPIDGFAPVWWGLWFIAVWWTWATHRRDKK